MKFWSKGFGALELVLTVAILTIFLGGFWLSYAVFLRTSLNNLQSVKAAYLLEEGLEVVKFLKSANWGNLANLETETEYGLAFDGENWTIVSPGALIDSLYDRRFSLFEVRRDEQGRLSESGNLDPRTRRVNFSISWQSRGTVVAKSLTTYLSDF